MFDPISTVIAVAAVLISWRAYVLTKRAPREARQATLRDQLRAVLEPALEELNEHLSEIERGHDVGESWAAVTAADKLLGSIGSRQTDPLPMQAFHSQTQSGLGLAEAQWSSARHSQWAFSVMAADLADWERKDASGPALKEGIAQGRTELERLRRERDAAISRLSSALKTAIARVEKEIQVLDKADVRGR
ncbi:hypothetical protein ACFSBZ_06785 [Amnibacterium flavum]|uniref:hypothetical protein n=1 Tax=Amnibacterium flavum TaxID=2173173 RepID=UPI001057AB53|nr:hypothetical protein [Amnibacterium flavum]